MSGKETVKFGYLTKSPPDNKNAFYGWKRRYFIFIDSTRAFPFAPRNIRIEYYYNYEDSKLGNPLGLIELNNCSGVLKREQMKSHKHVFDIVTPTRVYHLSAECKEEREGWVEVLNTIVFSFNRVSPVKTEKLYFDPYRRSSDFTQEIDLSMNMNNQTGPRAQSLREAKSTSVLPSSPGIMEDMSPPFIPTAGANNAAPSTLKIKSSQNQEPDQIYRNSFCENEIFSEKGFTAVPVKDEDMMLHSENMLSSLPIQNESPYMNVGFANSTKSANVSPTHPMKPAPYKRVPVSVSMQTIAHQKLSNDEIESEYTCIDSSTITPVLEEYAKVQKHK